MTKYAHKKSNFQRNLELPKPDINKSSQTESEKLKDELNCMKIKYEELSARMNATLKAESEQYQKAPNNMKNDFARESFNTFCQTNNEKHTGTKKKEQRHDDLPRTS